MDIQPQYVPLSTLLANRLFKIPRYQRAYSWTSKQRSDMFEDIRALKGSKEDTFHFMATVVGLRRETKVIVTDQYKVVEIVDGQQRLTTLVVLLKAIEKKLNAEDPMSKKLSGELQELLVKQDNVSLILLQTNHDRNHYFIEYLRNGHVPAVEQAETLADREIICAFHECEKFVDTWTDCLELLRILKNQLTFIFHEIRDESTVYTVFEVLNNRGLRVAWLDRLKSMLMSVAFEQSGEASDEHIEELHNIWGSIYESIGLRQGLSTESLKFAATLHSTNQPSKPYGEPAAVEVLRNCKSTKEAIDTSRWILKVTEAVDKFLSDSSGRREAVTEIQQARLLAISVILKGYSVDEETALLELWEKTTFRVFGLCRKDARTAVGDYVRLAWDILNVSAVTVDDVAKHIGAISEGKEHSIDWAVVQIENENCYEGWEKELRYLLFRYDEYLSELSGQRFSNEQWNRIWASSATRSIEHILPQSKGFHDRTTAGNSGVFVHRLGNLVLLPPGLNSKLQDLEPKDKAEHYFKTGLASAAEIAKTVADHGWQRRQVEEREQKLIAWIRQTWA